MENNIIKQITDINNEINFDYRKSKLPIFIKNKIAESKRKKLKKVIYKIKYQMYIPVKLLSDYLKVISYTYPPFGNYKNCIKITTIDEDKGLYAAIFELKMKDAKTSLVVSVAPVNENNNLFMINYKYGTREKIIIEFTDESVDILEIKDFKNIDSNIKNTEEYQHCRDIFCNMIIDNLSSYLLSLIERSERINV